MITQQALMALLKEFKDEIIIHPHKGILGKCNGVIYNSMFTDDLEITIVGIENTGIYWNVKFSTFELLQHARNPKFFIDRIYGDSFKITSSNLWKLIYES